MPYLPVRTIKQTLRTIRLNGCTANWRPQYGEFRVNVKGGTEATAYYTNDRQDAIATGKAMALFAL